MNVISCICNDWRLFFYKDHYQSVISERFGLLFVLAAIEAIKVMRTERI